MTGSLASSIERARRGDADAFDELVRALHAPLVRFTAAILGGDVHSAHDVVQEALVALWGALPTLAEPRFVRAWCYRVAYRRAVSWLRRRGPGGRPFGHLTPDGEEPPGPDATPSARTWNLGGAWLPSEEATPRLRAALGSLPALYAAPLTLYYLESLDLRETASLLGLSVTTLKMRLHRGRELLRTRVLTKEPWPPIRTRTPRAKVKNPTPTLVAGAATAAPSTDPATDAATDAVAYSIVRPASAPVALASGSAVRESAPAAGPDGVTTPLIERALP